MSFININFAQKKAPKGAFCIVVVEILRKSVVDCSSQNDNKKCNTEYEFVILNSKESIFISLCHAERSRSISLLFLFLKQACGQKGHYRFVHNFVNLLVLHIFKNGAQAQKVGNTHQHIGDCGSITQIALLSVV